MSLQNFQTFVVWCFWGNELKRGLDRKAHHKDTIILTEHPYTQWTVDMMKFEIPMKYDVLLVQLARAYCFHLTDFHWKNYKFTRFKWWMCNRVITSVLMESMWLHNLFAFIFIKHISQCYFGARQLLNLSLVCFYYNYKCWPCQQHGSRDCNVGRSAHHFDLD